MKTTIEEADRLDEQVALTVSSLEEEKSTLKIKVGEKYSRLLICSIFSRKVKNGKKSVTTKFVHTKCDCGTEKDIRLATIKDGRTKSCGCLNYQSNTVDPIVKACNYVHTYVAQSAKKRKLTYSLSLSDIRSFIFRPCSYCGDMPVPSSISRAQAGKYASEMASHHGLDRIDPSKGYELSNIATCCSSCNTAKLDMSLPEFKIHIAKMHAKLNEKNLDKAIPVSQQVWKYYDGSVILSDYMGSDLSVVNAARVSFGKQKSVMEPGDVKLINYLATHKHMSPFRHVQISLILNEIPEFILRQLYKHQVGLSYTAGDFREAATVWNELSGRYVEFDLSFFEPASFRPQHESNKQASYKDRTVSNEDEIRALYQGAIQNSWNAYHKMLEAGVSKEQARLVIPLAFKTSVIWTGSLEAFAHFVKLRDHEGAQVEIQTLAQIVHQVLERVAPESTKALLQN